MLHEWQEWHEFCTAIVLFVFTALIFVFGRRKNSTLQDQIPTAGGALPLLGHALLYKKDPALFLTSLYQELGPIFRINLAGRRMIVVCGNRSLLHQVANVPERILSAKDAVASIGFEQTLGMENVHRGTEFHKRVLKASFYESLDSEIPCLLESLKQAFRAELNFDKSSEPSIIVSDFLQMIRRCVFRAMIDRLLGCEMLRLVDEDGFVEKFMMFQDKLEDATVQAAVLPKIIAIPLVLMPVSRDRLKLQRILSGMVEKCWLVEPSNVRNGPWINAFRRVNMTSSKAAELIVGLLFAAHKNPAIGAAQSFLFMMERDNSVEIQSARSESSSLLYNSNMPDHGNSSGNLSSVLNGCNTLRRCCLETLRLTSHTIGAVRYTRQPLSLSLSTCVTEKCGYITTNQTITIPRGQTIALSHIVSSLDQNFWSGKNTSQYDPDRLEWSKPASKGILPQPSSGLPDEYTFTTFSHGMHKCPGEKLALVIMQLSLAILLGDNSLIIKLIKVPNISFERATLAQREDAVVVEFLKNE
eukprot:CAMPEP_0194384220 /NCGR_PEP_ID=MMETSP0174-20130528/72643_1 /TAXON_ID=216777 /ORGANISM="Proboscia alata, Strain PI-D3" /LENGTH=527 /DNA_ID=CAMNT_0039171199 /DNA_START=9 /DNA_END=1592 /DNA_ORIENTATION=+